jgi:hypothetical protein
LLKEKKRMFGRYVVCNGISLIQLQSRVGHNFFFANESRKTMTMTMNAVLMVLLNITDFFVVSPKVREKCKSRNDFLEFYLAEDILRESTRLG